MSLNVNGKQPVRPVNPQPSDASGVYVVKAGDSLSGIAKKLLGDADKWVDIYKANKQAIGPDPDHIRIGTRLNIPGLKQDKPAAKPEKPAEKPAEKSAEKPPVSTQPSTPTTPATPVTPTTPPVSTQPSTPATPVTPTTPQDSVDLSQGNYPTVGDYVKKEFKETMDGVATVMQGTAEIAFPPLLLGEIAAIKGKHEMAAMQKIWNLPMDPEGKWKDKARQIMDEEATLASKEISELPAIKAAHIAAVTVKDGVIWTGQKIGEGVQWAGKTLAKAGEAVVDGMVYTGVAIGKGVEWTGQKIQEGAIAAGEAVKDGAQAIKEGVEWTGQKIAEGAEAVADATVSGAKAVGNGVAWVGHEYVEANKSIARGFLSGLKAIGSWLTGSADKALPATTPTPYEKPFK